MMGRDKATRCLSILFLVFALVIGVTYALQVHSQEVRAHCQASYDKAFSQQLTDRSHFVDEDTNSVTALLSGVGKLIALPPTKDPKVMAARDKTFRDLFVAFDRDRAALAADKAAHPLPPTPDC